MKILLCLVLIVGGGGGGGIKLDIIFSSISVNVCTCQLRPGIKFKWAIQGKLLIVRRIKGMFPLLKCQIFLSNEGGGSSWKFIRQQFIWCWQKLSKVGQVPLPITKFGWSEKIKSIDEGFLWGSKFVGSWIKWLSPNRDVNCPISLLSAMISPSFYHNSEWPLKSPEINIQYGFSFFADSQRVSSSFRNLKNSGDPCV